MFELLMFGAGLWTALIAVVVWEIIWKGIAMWKAGRNCQKAWFVWLLILNTAGILPILYLAFYQKESKESKMIRSLERQLERKK